MTGRPRLSVVVPLHNAEPYLVEMFERLFLSALPAALPPDSELVLVDDASPLEKETAALAERAAASVPTRLIRNPANLGYTRSANVGLRAAAGERVLLSNSDVRLCPGSVERLLRTLESDPVIGMVGPVTNNAFSQSDQQVEGLGPLKDFSDEELARLDAFARAVGCSAGAPFPVRHLLGFCTLMRREVLERVGYLDESFGLGYYEETDYCYRARGAGFTLLIDPSAFVHHGGLRASWVGGERGGSQSMRLRPWRSAWAIFVNSFRMMRRYGWAGIRGPQRL